MNCLERIPYSAKILLRLPGQNLPIKKEMLQHLQVRADRQ